MREVCRSLLRKLFLIETLCKVRDSIVSTERIGIATIDEVVC